LLWGLVAGVTGGAGLACLYSALALGKMGLNAPLSAVIAAIVPLLFSLFSEGVPHVWQLVGFAVALASIWLIATQSGATIAVEADGKPNLAVSLHDNRGLFLAIASGFGLGAFLLLIKFAGSSTVFWPLVMARLGSAGLMLVIVGATRGEWQPKVGSMPWVVLAGLFDTGANALYVAAVHRGSLAVAAVLSSLYPASTVILARLVLKEQWSRLQAAGMLAALVAVALISS
jgi:drug/metabolite transporter (DMT)-like permease